MWAESFDIFFYKLTARAANQISECPYFNMLLLNFICIIGLAIGIQARGLDQTQTQRNVNQPITVTEADGDYRGRYSVIVRNQDTGAFPPDGISVFNIDREPMGYEELKKGSDNNEVVYHHKINFGNKTNTEAHKEFDMKEMLGKLPFVEKLKSMFEDTKEIVPFTTTATPTTKSVARPNGNSDIMQICAQLNYEQLHVLMRNLYESTKRYTPPTTTPMYYDYEKLE